MRSSSAVAGPGRWAGIAPLLAYPAAQRLSVSVDLGCDGFDRRPLQAVLAAGFADRA